MTNSEKDRMIDNNDWITRLKMAEEGYVLDVLINDKDYFVRKDVLSYLKENNLTLAEWCKQNNKEIDLKKLAYSPYSDVRAEAIKSGYVYKKDEIYIDSNCEFTPYGTDPEKDEMVKSNDYRDRLEMAKEGYGLDALINDKDEDVRAAIAEQGYSLNVLIKDENCDVRTAVAEQGYDLGTLVKDKHWCVREAVARRGYDLDVLINDENEWVREATLSYLKENNLTLAKWCSQNNKKIDLKELAYSIYPEIRAEAVRSGYVYKKNEIYIDSNCKFTPYGTVFKKDKMVNSYNYKNRIKIAKKGYGLDILINDEDRKVREAVVEQGYGLNILVNDEDELIRRTVAKRGYGLDILINDESKWIRRVVARQGYGLDILVNDKDYDVQEAVKNYLTSHNLTLDKFQ